MKQVVIDEIERGTRDSDRATTAVAMYAARPGRSSLRTTFQLAADLTLPDHESVDDTFAAAARVALDWLGTRFPEAVPRSAWNLESFDLDLYGHQQLQGVSVPERGLWSVRLVHPDGPFKDRPAVAGRTWTTELALHRSDGGVQFGARVACASASYTTEPIALTRPGVVLHLARRFGLREIRPLDGRPWVLQTEDDLRALYDLLTDERRTMPVVMLTRPNPRDFPGRVSEYLLDQEALARRTQGFAHVVCMPNELGYGWTDMVGKVWSAFMGAVRTYYPRLDFENDSPFAHPRILTDRVISWQHNGLVGEEALNSFLVDKLQEQAATKFVDWGGCMFFADARSQRASLERERIRKEFEGQRSHVDEVSVLRARVEAMEKTHDEELAALNSQLQGLGKERDEALQMAVDADSEQERVKCENRSLQFQNDALRRAIESKSGVSADVDTPIPDNYEDIPDWVEDHLTGRLFLHPRGVRGLKKAQYEDTQLVFHSLLLLAREYRNWRLGYEGAEQAWEERRNELGLECSRSITEARAGEEGDTYYVNYPLGTGKRSLLDLHLRKGNDREPRHCLRIYYFWDEETSQVVVGSLPGHLDIRST